MCAESVPAKMCRIKISTRRNIMFVVIADHVFNDMVGDGNVKLFCSMFSKEENVCSPIGFAFGDIIFHRRIKCQEARALLKIRRVICCPPSPLPCAYSAHVINCDQV